LGWLDLVWWIGLRWDGLGWLEWAWLGLGALGLALSWLGLCVGMGWAAGFSYQLAACVELSAWVEA